MHFEAIAPDAGKIQLSLPLLLHKPCISYYAASSQFQLSLLLVYFCEIISRKLFQHLRVGVTSFLKPAARLQIFFKSAYRYIFQRNRTKLKLNQMQSQGVTDLAKLPIHCGFRGLFGIKTKNKKDENENIQFYFNNICASGSNKKCS
jgi:hypothetical protein